MFSKLGGGGENVTPEVTAQTPIIAEIAEKFGVSITTPSGSNKQILQGNNENMQNIKLNAKKSGAYAWKKYENISLISFNVDSLTFQAEDGMTWQDFINSSYNNGNFSTATYSGNTYVTYSNPVMAPQINDGVLISDLIRDGVKYVTEFGGIICDPNKPM